MTSLLVAGAALSVAALAQTAAVKALTPTTQLAVALAPQTATTVHQHKRHHKMHLKGENKAALPGAPPVG